MSDVASLLFSPAEVAGRQEPGSRTGAPCPSCGTRGYEMVTASFGLCQRPVELCRLGRTTAARTAAKAAAPSVCSVTYRVHHVEVTELYSRRDGTERAAVEAMSNGRIMLCPDVLDGFRSEEWRDGRVLANMDPRKVYAVLLGRPLNPSVVTRLQVNHPDRLLLIESRDPLKAPLTSHLYVVLGVTVEELNVPPGQPQLVYPHGPELVLDALQGYTRETRDSYGLHVGTPTAITGPIARWNTHGPLTLVKVVIDHAARTVLQQLG